MGQQVDPTHATGPTGKYCVSPFPSVSDWQKADASIWPLGYARDTALFAAALGAGAIGHDSDIGSFRLIDALNDAANPLNAKAAAVFLGSISYAPPTPDVVKALWMNGVRGGGYAALGYRNENTLWHSVEVEKYFDYLLGPKP